MFMQRGQRDGQVLEVATDADALGEDIHGGLGGAGGLVVERNLAMDPIADGSGALPAGSVEAEKVLGDAAELVDLAVARGQQKLERFSGKLLHGRLRQAEALQIGHLTGAQDVGAREADGPGRGDEA